MTAPTLAGLPTIKIAGFATAGATQPIGRIDTTGHVTDTLNWTSGRHQIKAGGGYRRAVLNVFYESNTRGTFSFDGTRGPWASSSAYSLQQKALADFLAGYPTNSSGATIVRPAPGVKLAGSFLQRTYTQESVDWFFHDTWGQAVVFAEFSACATAISGRSLTKSMRSRRSSLAAASSARATVSIPSVSATGTISRPVWASRGRR